MNKERHDTNIIDFHDLKMRRNWSARESEEPIYTKIGQNKPFKIAPPPFSLEFDEAIMNIESGYQEQAYSHSKESEGDNNMTNHFENKFIESIKELKDDFKEREQRFYDESQRINTQFKEREDRVINDADAREKRYQEEMKRLREESIEREERARKEAEEREERSRRDAKEREERLINLIEKNSKDMKEELKEVKESVKTSEKHIQTLVSANVSSNRWGIATTVIAIIAIVVTFYLAVNSINQSLNNKEFDDLNKKIEQLNQNQSKTE